MQVASVHSGSAATATAAPNTAGSLGKDDFLKLLIAQLRNQDPMKPMEDEAFIAQLAQFNSLEQMQQMNETIAAMAARDQITQASGLIGKRVEYYSLKQQKPVQGTVTEVRLVDGRAMLKVGDEFAVFDQVLRIMEAPNGTGT